MERYYVIAPALIPAAYMISMFLFFCVRSAIGRRPEVEGLNRRRFSDLIGPFLTTYFLWVVRPVERLFISARVSPNHLTGTSLFLAAIAGVTIATEYLATAAWAYAVAGMLDVLDGRLARATGCSSKAGAFLDSVSDRWAELFVLAGFAWYLRDSYWLGAVMLAIGGSMMVSYTRARGEGLELNLDGGTMQRAERIVLVALGTFAAAVLHAAPNTVAYAPHVLGVTLMIVGLGATTTSLGRWIKGYRILQSRERDRERAQSSVVLSANQGPGGPGNDLARPDSHAA